MQLPSSCNVRLWQRKQHECGVQDFADTSAPALMPIFQSAKGETLLLLVRSTPTLLQSMPRPYVTSMMVPLLVRAADQGAPAPTLPCSLPSSPCFLSLCTQYWLQICLPCATVSGAQGVTRVNDRLGMLAGHSKHG